MKAIKFVSGVLVSFIFCLSCNDVHSPELTSCDSAIVFSSSIGEQMISKSRVYGFSWEAGDMIGIYMKKTGEEFATGTVKPFSNIKYKTAGDGIFAPFYWGGALRYPVDGSAVDFMAYYPYCDDIVDFKFPVDVSDQSSQTEIDLLYSNNAVNKDKNSPLGIRLNFTHQLTKIVLNITGENISDLSELKVSLEGTKTKAVFDLANGILELLDTEESIYLKTIKDEAKVIAEAIILPTDAMSGRSFVFELSDGRKFRWDIPETCSFQKGKKHIYNVTLKSDIIDFINPIADIIEWNNMPPETITTLDKSYKLVWKEDFDLPILDRDVWNVEIVRSPANNEYQYYKKENISVETEPISGKRCLVLTAKKENFDGRAFTSGRINTSQKVAFKYGRLDASIKVPKTANGLWPAFWMKGDDYEMVGWPMCGEIDILEMGHVDGVSGGNQECFLGSACHWGPSFSQYKSDSKKNTFSFSLQEDDFHLYSLIWDKNSIKMYLDLDKNPTAEPYYTFHYVTNPDNAIVYMQKEYYILFNLAVGGGYTGITGIDNIDKITALNENNGYEAKMYIDYVKIYQNDIDGGIITIK